MEKKRIPEPSSYDFPLTLTLGLVLPVLLLALIWACAYVIRRGRKLKRERERGPLPEYDPEYFDDRYMINPFTM